jgi:hypothetical protein
MSPDDRHDPAVEADSDQPTALVLELSLDSGDPIGGFVGRAGNQMRREFRGWVDLMSAINSIRSAAGNTDEALPPR